MTKNLLAALAFLPIISAGTAFAENGLFRCQATPGGLTNCSVAKTQLADSAAVFEGEPYLATYAVTYKFACSPGGFDSNIVLHAGRETTSNTKLVYDESHQIPLEGPGPLTLSDKDATDTGFQIFNPGCDLDITYVKAPSKDQIHIWEGEVAGISEKVDLALPMVNLIPDIKMWYEANIADPAGTAGFLRSQIEGLRQPGASSTDLAQADAYQAIIDGNPLATVLEPLKPAVKELEAVYERGQKLKRKLVFSAGKNQDVLDKALERTKTALKGAK